MIFENNVNLIMMMCCFKVNTKVQCERYFGKPHSNKNKNLISSHRGRLSHNLLENKNETVPWPPFIVIDSDGVFEYII